MKPINEQINADIVRQARKLSQYKQLLNKILPIECLNHVEVANIRNQNLMLITDSPVWTTRLRQLSPQILEFLSKNNLNGNNSQIIHHVQIKTRYLSADESQSKNPEKKEYTPPDISNKTAELLSQSANSIDHPQLKDALLKIAKHGKKKS